jgi:hypothetical protein
MTPTTKKADTLITMIYGLTLASNKVTCTRGIVDSNGLMSARGGTFNSILLKTSTNVDETVFLSQGTHTIVYECWDLTDFTQFKYKQAGVVVGAATAASAVVTALDTYATLGTYGTQYLQRCLYAEEFYEDANNPLSAPQRDGQVQNCYNALTVATDQQLFDNLQYSTMEREMYEEAISILTAAFTSLYDSSTTDPGTTALSLWLNYLFVQATDEMPGTSITLMKSVSDTSMSTLLNKILADRNGMTSVTIALINKILDIYKSGEKASAEEGVVTSYTLGTALHRWGRIKVSGTEAALEMPE